MFTQKHVLRNELNKKIYLEINKQNKWLITKCKTDCAELFCRGLFELSAT